MNYAIERFGKIKTQDHLCKSAAHNERQIRAMIPNVDTSKSRLNEIMRDTSAPILERWRSRIGSAKIRKNAVIAFEVLCGFSPEARDTIDLDGWKRDTLRYLEDEFGAENIISCVLHADEKTPHIQAIVVPIDKRGRLNCREMLGGQAKLIRLQDRYAQRCRKYGLVRGTRGSERQHIPQKAVYQSQRAIDESINKLKELPRKIETLELPVPSIGSVISKQKKDEYIHEVREVIETKVEETANAVQSIEGALEARVFAERDRLALQKLAQDKNKLQADNDQYIKETQQLRDIPLEDVLSMLGFAGHREGGQMVFETPASKIAIQGAKFYDFKNPNNKLGGGSIDLVMHVLQCDFNEAVRWLKTGHGDQAIRCLNHALLTVNKTTLESQRPMSFEEKVAKFASRDDSRWIEARKYLINRAISEQAIDDLFTKGQVYASSLGGVVFPHWNLRSGQFDGATIRGIYSNFKQTIGNRSNSFFYAGEPIPTTRKIFLTESPIDALSLREIVPTRDATYVSTAGTPDVRIIDTLPDLAHLVLGFDVDPAGKQFRERFETALVERNRGYDLMTPSNGKDWNDELIHLRKRSHTLPPDSDHKENGENELTQNRKTWISQNHCS